MGGELFGLWGAQAAGSPPDLVERDSAAERPNQLWAADLTQAATWSGVAYVWFITDAFPRRIAGWRVAPNMATQMALDALETARWNRGARLEELAADAEPATAGWVHRRGHPPHPQPPPPQPRPTRNRPHCPEHHQNRQENPNTQPAQNPE